MLFNSGIFLFAFLPTVLLVFGLLFRYRSLEAAWMWLAAASVFFYGWWNPAHIPLLLGSVCANFWLGKRLADRSHSTHGWLLAGGVIVNLGLLGFFKYWNFFASNVALVFGLEWHSTPLELPLGISFYTFHQLTYLWHCKAGRAGGTTFRHYLLYVTFYPQLIAGPIVRPMELLPQLQEARSSAFRWNDLSLGFTLLAFGLFKKMVIADHVAGWVSPVFDQPIPTNGIQLMDAWVASLAYTLQLYFDFSAYSDMALGLAKMLGLGLPGNFFSPYKATSITDFWRRWHITLSLFLRDYLYIPLGGNRLGEPRRYFNLILVMTVGGFWHGAGWTFGLWGLLHGTCLAINHGWHKWGRIRLGVPISWTVTFLSVVAGWVLFRSPSIETAGSILKACVGGSGFSIPSGWISRLPFLEAIGVTANSDWIVFSGPGQILAILGLLIFTLISPNALQLTASAFQPPNEASLPQPRASTLQWKPNLLWALFTALLFAISLLHLGQLSEFLYFQF
tara:strand:+ start:895 stop:2412 length:1518 start_codon:yes stop_codon:yes gene_type:complete